MEEQRWEILGQIEDWFEIPMIVLGFVWLALLIVELAAGVSPFLESVSTGIWILFGIDFAIRFLLAPSKSAYLRSNWITALALVLPAFRVLRAARILRVFRGLRLIRLVTSLNRGMRALGRTMRRRRLGYVVALTTLVTFTGAAGMLAFERLPRGQGLQSYPEALWWTAMLLTTIGSEYWPVTGEGRVLSLLLSMYALGVLGYITAALASFFLGRDAESPDAEVASEAMLRQLHAELISIREELAARDR